jgi:hypothetical protein
MAWWDPEISLPTQFDMERDRRAAAMLDRDGLCERVDRLIIDWYRHRAALQDAAREISGLQCQLAMAQAPCTQGQNPPSAEHYAWANEVLSRPGPA